jgi:Zn-dependent protease with chaperone function
MVKVRAALALLVLALFPVLVLALLAGLCVAAVWSVRYSGVAAGKILLYLALPLVVAVGVAVRDVLRARPEPTPGPELGRAEHPQLWREVDTLATGLGTPAPARIVVTPEVNAGVREVRGVRELGIGLPLLAGLTVPELRSVLGHELGHYGAGHTRLLAMTYRATDTVLGTVRHSSGLLRRLLTVYARVYLVVAAAANRAQEQEADAYSARVAGPGTAAEALRMVAALDIAWDALTRQYLPLAGPARRRPRVCEGLQEVLHARAAQLEEAVSYREAAQVEPAPGDSHPPLGQRIARFEALSVAGGPGRGAGTNAVQDAVPDAGQPAWTLLGGGWRGLTAVEQDLLRDPDPDASWEEIVALAGAARAAHVAGRLVRAAQGVAGRPASLTGILDALEQGRGRELVAPVVDPALHAQDRPAAERQALTELLAASVVDALVVADTAYHRLDWEGPWQLIVRTPEGEVPLDAEELVAPAVADPAAVPALRSLLAELGAALDHAAAATAPADPDPVGLLTRVKGPARTAVDVLVCDTGLLVVPSPARSRLTAGLRQVTGGAVRTGSRQVERLLSVPHAERLAVPGARWIGTADISAAKLGRRPWGWTLRLRLADGQVLSMRSTNETDEHGQAYTGLGVLLGSRIDKGAWAAASATG